MKHICLSLQSTGMRALCWFTGQLQVHKVRTCLIEKETYYMRLLSEYQTFFCINIHKMSLRQIKYFFFNTQIVKLTKDGKP